MKIYVVQGVFVQRSEGVSSLETFVNVKGFLSEDDAKRAIESIKSLQAIFAFNQKKYVAEINALFDECGHSMDPFMEAWKAAKQELDDKYLMKNEEFYKFISSSVYEDFIIEELDVQ